MKRLFSSVYLAVLLLCSSLAQAYIVEDIVVFDQYLSHDEYVSWVHDLSQYGLTPGMPRPDFIMHIEVFDLDDYPGKEDRERPFFSLSQGHGRQFGRIAEYGIIVDQGDMPYIDSDGKIDIRLLISDGNVWLNRVVLTVDITPIPAPASMGLLMFGLGIIALRRLRRKSLLRHT